MIICMTELIVLADDNGNVVGTAPKLASHHSATPLHFAFSCYLFNAAGEFLLTQRAHVKKVWPDVWTNSACGHPGPDESNEAAIKRRVAYELGITELTDIAVIDANYRYKTPPYNGIIENEICPIYIARTSQDPVPNPDEVEDWRWLHWDEVLSLKNNGANDYSYWFLQQRSIVDASPLLATYTEALR